MIVEKTKLKRTFEPISIVIQSKRELEFFICIFNASQIDKAKYANGYIPESYDILKFDSSELERVAPTDIFIHLCDYLSELE